ncbi:hypothetical protein EYV94_21305 [Puteibacter caeruleilacunae]|nr:hypothetical protein EYV94_21305 [Puteibacter caeruleilacunae]
MNPFLDQYQSASNIELFRIIDDAENYQPLAVDAAQAIIDSRKLTEEEVNRVKEELALIHHEKIQDEERKQYFKQLILQKFDNFIGFGDLKQGESAESNKTIASIVVVYGIAYVFMIFSQIDILPMMLFEFNDWDYSTFLYFLPIVMLPIAISLFWKRKKIGWILLSFYLINKCVSTAIMLESALRMDEASDTIFDSLFITPSVSTCVFLLLFYGATVLVIGRSVVRMTFSVSRLMMLIVVVVALIVSAFIDALIFLL